MMVKRGDAIGYPVGSALGGATQHDWDAELAAIAASSRVAEYPAYCLQPFHAYQTGNLSLDAALEVDLAARAVHASVFDPEVGSETSLLRYQLLLLTLPCSAASEKLGAPGSGGGPCRAPEHGQKHPQPMLPSMCQPRKKTGSNPDEKAQAEHCVPDPCVLAEEGSGRRGNAKLRRSYHAAMKPFLRESPKTIPGHGMRNRAQHSCPV